MPAEKAGPATPAPAAAVTAEGVGAEVDALRARVDALEAGQASIKAALAAAGYDVDQLAAIAPEAAPTS